jgi:predicted DsbA family dithiol-disulfide isomerase
MTGKAWGVFIALTLQDGGLLFMADQTLQIDVFSDVVCPWCFIGKRRLEEALALYAQRRPQGPSVLVRFKPFELNPQLPEDGVSREQYLNEKFGARAAQIYERVSAVGQSVGIAFAFNAIERQPNTAKCHALLMLAQDPALQFNLKEALMRAYFLLGKDLSKDQTLRSIALEVGMSNPSIEQSLSDPVVMGWVKDQERAAAELGISGVPFFVFNGRLAVSGAQEAAVLLQAMEEALEEPKNP